MKPSESAYRLIKLFEGCKLSAYRCPANVVTIGWGSTLDAFGKPIKMGSKITQDQADNLLIKEVNLKAVAVNKLTTNLNQNQFDSLVSFAFNCGVGALSKSTLLKKIKLNPNDPAIHLEFMKWDKVAGKSVKGLTTRRAAESQLYFTK
jgi:lysozyme